MKRKSRWTMPNNQHMPCSMATMILSVSRIFRWRGLISNNIPGSADGDTSAMSRGMLLRYTSMAQIKSVPGLTTTGVLQTYV